MCELCPLDVSEKSCKVCKIDFCNFVFKGQEKLKGWAEKIGWGNQRLIVLLLKGSLTLDLI